MARFGIVPALVVIGALGTAAAEDKVVHVYNWSDYVAEEVLERFTEETGIKVVYDVYDNNDIVETKLLAGDSGYDIVVPTDASVARQIRAGTLAELDKTRLPNLANAWPFVMDRLTAYDPGNRYAVNYMWGTGGFGINLAMAKARLEEAPLDSWAVIFNPAIAAKLADCGIHMLDSPEDAIQAALIYLGLNPDSKATEDIDRAMEVLRGVRPFIQKFESSEYINALANGDICVAMGYSGDVLQSRARAEEAGNGVVIEYVIPKEGAMMWLDSFVIPEDAPHPDAAHAFIDFMLRPDVAAANTNAVYYANGNLASQPLVAPEITGDPAIYPDAATLRRLRTTTPYDAATQRRLTRFWASLKAAN